MDAVPKTLQERLEALCRAYMEDDDIEAFKAGLEAIKRDFEPEELKQLRADVARLWGQANPEKLN